MKSVLVRGAESGDLPALTDLYNHYVKSSPATFDLEPASLASRRLWMTRYANAGPHRLFVAIDQGALAGYATSGKLREKPGYLTSVETTVYCAPDVGGRGVGTRLYAELFPMLRERGVHAVMGGIALPNDGSVALHEKFGMKKVAHFEQTGFKFDGWIDVGYWELLVTQ